MQLSPDQEQAAAAIKRWYEYGHERVFVLHGFAGCGKSTLAKYIVAGLRKVKPEQVAHMAYTGKAAMVMRQKGCDNATTIHQAIYKPEGGTNGKITELTQALLQEPEEGKKARLRGQIVAMRAECGGASWKLEATEEVAKAKIIVIDECSMLSQRIMEDLLRATKAKILLLGDPGQLPPVMSSAIKLPPNFTLTEIHRQARDNPLLRFANDVRATGKIVPCDITNEQGSITVGNDIPPEEWLKVDQIIVARNDKRRKVNQRMRFLRGGHEAGAPPTVGDKLVILRNDHDLGVFNGMTGALDGVLEPGEGSFTSDFISDGVGGVIGDMIPALNFSKAGFNEISLNDVIDQEFVVADYGYALTCHKAQGSEWDSVGIIMGRDTKDFAKFCYTAVTRARKRCILLVQ